MGVAIPAFEREGAEVRVVDAWSPDTEWDGIWKDAAGIVVFGGEMNADAVEHHPYLAGERDLLGTAVDMNVPVLGVCLGGQLLARALGAEVTQAPVRELGFADASIPPARRPTIRSFRSSRTGTRCSSGTRTRSPSPRTRCCWPPATTSRTRATGTATARGGSSSIRR